jgi:hypothetical protein
LWVLLLYSLLVLLAVRFCLKGLPNVKKSNKPNKNVLRYRPGIRLVRWKVMKSESLRLL